MLDWAKDIFSEKMGPEQDPKDQGLRKVMRSCGPT